MTMRASGITWVAVGALTVLSGISACNNGGGEAKPQVPKADKPPIRVASEQAEPVPEAPEPVKLLDPIPLWVEGDTVRNVDAATASADGYLVLELGEVFTPYLFTDGIDEAGAPLKNHYRETYLALAQEKFPDNHHGDRADRDKYLELYGIVPTLKVLRARLEASDKLACGKELDLQPLIDFSKVVTYRSNNAAKRGAGDFVYLRNRVRKFMRKQQVESAEEVDAAALSRRDKDVLKRFKRKAPAYYAVRALQERLKCEGFFKGRGRYVKGAMDWPTHDALAEFERRHRVYSWGYIGRDSLAVLRISPLEAEREAVLRVLNERAVHAAGVIEDGSTSTLKDGTARTFKGRDGELHPVPNLEADLRQKIVQAFGLQTPASTLEFLQGLGELSSDGSMRVAIRAPELPEYYDADMALTLVYDRGDVWYDFPYDEEGKERAQPVARRPRVTLFTKYEGQRIPLARFGTTIGGWRSDKVDEAIMWKYKGSPVGDRVWQNIVAAPVWLPPASTPDKDLLSRKHKRKPGEPKLEVNYHETGPSYASAYGLVAAYHRKFVQKADGTVLIGGDEGIRTHGSVDYMSIMRRHSHGCHRLHNHIAVRLMSFVLAHRNHRRMGQHPTAYFRELHHEDEVYKMEIKRGGYVFRLETPLHVTVLEGRIRGRQEEPIELPIPKFDREIGAYLMPDGGAVQLSGRELVAVPLPVVDGGVLDVPPGAVEDTAAAAQGTAPSILNPLRQSLGLPVAPPGQ